ncbi:MAG: GNAT family N-acetyltransferase [Chloroflexi bacterium]|nr:GNAT family N-acetyltransferase [Chloroflexota bacterium]
MTTTRSTNPVGDATSLADRITLRPYRGPQDHPEMNRVANLVRAANGDPELGTVADMDGYYIGFDQDALTLDCALAEHDGRVVGYGRISWEDLATGEGGEIGGVLNVDPALVGRGIEARLVEHAISRTRTLVETRGRTASSVVRIWATGRDTAQQAALEAAGFRRVRASAQLIRPDLENIPGISLPDGFEIRPIAADDRAMHRRVWDADARGFAGSWGQEAPSERRFQAWLTNPAFDPPLWRVAFHGDDIAGQILNFMGEAEADGSRIGFTEAISVQPEFRRRGLARALLAASLRAVRDAGAVRAGLGVDSQNPNQAQALYESMGYRVVSVSYTYELGPFEPGSAGPRLPHEAADGEVAS